MDRQRYRDDRRQSGPTSYRRGYQDEGRRNYRYEEDRGNNYNDFDDFYDRSPQKRRRRDDYEPRGDHYEKRYRSEEQYFTRKGQQYEADDWMDDRRGNYSSYHRNDEYDDSRNSRNMDRRRSYDNFNKRDSDGFQRRGRYQRNDNINRRGNFVRRDNVPRRNESDRRPSRPFRPRGGRMSHSDYHSRGGYKPRGGYQSRGGYQRRDDSYSHRPFKRRTYNDYPRRSRDDSVSSSEWSGIDEGDDEKEEKEDETKNDKDSEEKVDEENKVSSTNETEDETTPHEEDIESMPKPKLQDLVSNILLVLFDNFEGNTNLNTLRLELIMKDIVVFTSSTGLKDFLSDYRSVFDLRDPADENDDEGDHDNAPEQGEEEIIDEIGPNDDDEEEEKVEKMEEGSEPETEKDEKETTEEIKEVVKEEKEKKDPGSPTPEGEDETAENKEEGETKVEDEKEEDKEEEKEGSVDLNEEKDDQLIVSATPTLRLCLAHSTKAGSCKLGKCKALHVCRYFVLSKCDIVDTGKRCMFGHDMDSKYNRYILRKSLLHKFPPRMAQKVLLNLKYRNRTTLPVVCRFYNTYWGCKNSRNNSCPFLHICEDYVLGFCKNKKCRFRHDLSENQPSVILERYGMAPSEKYPTEDIIKALKRSTLNRGRRRNASQTQPSHRAQSVQSAHSDGEKEKVEEDVEMETKLKWQCRSTQQRGCAWLDIDDSNKIEDKYALYQNAKKYTFTMGERVSEIDFEKLSGHTTGGIHLEYRRVREKVPKKAADGSKTKPGTPKSKSKEDSEATGQTEEGEDEKGEEEKGEEEKSEEEKSEDEKGEDETGEDDKGEDEKTEN